MFNTIKRYCRYLYCVISRYLFSRNKKIALCCIAKCENDYIREFVEYYKSLGVDNIYIYDNNDINGERFEESISDYIETGFCIIENVRGKKQMQLPAYQHFYDNYSKVYDWVAFFDCDEFLTFTNPNENLRTFLSRSYFTKFQMIHVNWMLYGDNEMLDNDGRKVTERFAVPFSYVQLNTYNKKSENCTVKTIIRGGLAEVNCSIHTCYNFFCRCCDANGNRVDANSTFNEIDFTTAYIRHYSTKTIGEWIKIKQKRGLADMDDQKASQFLGLDYFFRYNRKTEEKLRYAEMLMEIGHE